MWNVTRMGGVKATMGLTASEIIVVHDTVIMLSADIRPIPKPTDHNSWPMLRDAPSGAPQHEVTGCKYRENPHTEEAPFETPPAAAPHGRLAVSNVWAVSLDQ